MKWILALALVSAISGRIWLRWFDDGKWTVGDFVALSVEAGSYLGMFGVIIFGEWC